MIRSLLLNADCIFTHMIKKSFVQDTHKFELGYNEQLIGKFPEERALYEQRSPLNHTDQLSTPVAFFHGEEDPVVPLTQSMQLHEALKMKGVPTSLTVFPGNFG